MIGGYSDRGYSERSERPREAPGNFGDPAPRAEPRGGEPYGRYGGGFDDGESQRFKREY